MKHLPINSPHFQALYKDFNNMIITKGYRQGKGCQIQSCVREFLFFIEIKGFTTIQVVKATEIISYYEYLRERPNQKTGGGLSESMIRHHLYALRLFFDDLVEREEIDSSPARLPKFQFGKYKERNICTIEEIKLLYSSCQNKREKALLGIAYGCGLRRSELENLNTTDVLLHKGMLLVREGKGSKSRTVPLSNNVVRDLKEYIIFERSTYFPATNYEETPAFFLNNKGKRMGGQYLGNTLKAIIERTQNIELLRKEITLHCLRHSIATHLLDNGANIEFVQQLLGHAEIDTAHLYSKRRKQQMKILSQVR
ncbi:MAG: tyrosine-type recombinase/integrase [Bacteroidetes bacterium]|nr:tyrosine-type recombinase/integrase [Bacteroidota bacterium]HET6244219.1 tyrosine-type recombinase/integrase [Bacteroidia bacterium]